MIFFDTIVSPIGNLSLVANETGLSQIIFENQKQFQNKDISWEQNSAKLKPIADQLMAYFNGELTKFDISLSPEGTVFQKQIWKHLLEIPYGETCSYQDIALAINKPNACRAIGMANSLNPIPIIVPCHRVIGKNGKLTGYAGGLETKAKLLEIENIDLNQNTSQYQLF